MPRSVRCQATRSFPLDEDLDLDLEIREGPPKHAEESPDRTGPPRHVLVREVGDIVRSEELAHRIQAGIVAAVQRAELPYTAVSAEVTSLVGEIERSAMRAQLLYEALSETPVASVEQRLARAGETQQPELALALREQLAAQRRM